ncbi:MAG: hypothetical protein ACT443_15985 [Gemmatimonadota bacterium]
MGRFLVAALLFTAGMPAGADAIPYFARRYGVSCQQCHVAPPKLNRFGERFLARGYAAPELARARGTWPFAVWASGRSESLPGAQAENDHELFPNRIEVISGGKVASWLSYFVEWRPLSLESRSDGSLRDRSGRFEDLFLLIRRDAFELTLGQFRQIAQVDVSRRLGLSEPLVLSSALPAIGGGRARERSLRSFSPAGRSPAVRLSFVQGAGTGWQWTTSAGIAVPGELSIPITSEAKTEASNEVEWRAKGVVAESFIRRGYTSVGAHVLYDNARRYLAHLVFTGAASDKWHWTVIGGAARAGDSALGRWSAEGEFIPRSAFAVGARVEDRASDGARIALLPFVNLHFPGSTYTVRLTIEQRLQRDRNATFIELGTVF